MIGTRARWVVAVGIVAVCSAVVLLPRARRKALPSGPSPHGAGIDRAMGAALALYQAPEGATPCESAYNAFKNSIDVSTQQQLKAVVLRLPPRDEFLARCATLPSAVQQCLVPQYGAAHRTECDKSKLPDDVIGGPSALVEIRQTAP